MPTKKYWMGDEPDRCDNCYSKITKAFSDARLPTGTWGIICEKCAGGLNIVYAVGHGQRYQLNPSNGKWEKTDG